MRTYFFLLLFGIIFSAGTLSAQEILPGITVKNYYGKIIVSWRNEYPLEVKTLNIQRSFDSAKNFSTIGSVLAPQNSENGFVDENPPYNRMYYRVFIAFDAGAYIFSESVRPVKDLPQPLPIIKSEIIVDPFKKADVLKDRNRDNKLKPGDKVTVPPLENNKTEIQPVLKDISKEKPGIKPKTEPVKPAVPVIPEENIITYPSRRIYTAKDNNIVINLPNTGFKRYLIKFFDEDHKSLFELNKIKEDFLIIEKVNFFHAGLFYFEIFENGKLIEKNKFIILK